MSRYHLIEHLVYEIHATIFPIDIDHSIFDSDVQLTAAGCTTFLKANHIASRQNNDKPIMPRMQHSKSKHTEETKRKETNWG